MPVLWRKRAAEELEAIYQYIKKDSPQNAVLVFNAIYDLAVSLDHFPYKFPAEPSIKIEKVRYAVIWSFKIVFSIEKDAVVILRVFNTRQNPRKLKK
ncbi:MAG TPA: type II toxin-antitoxin system RelE/ParE family toxin [Flavobacterium sp.]|nr:type II toxin-antitoxin system RelE/ParE family toxin [Flavobacterium sp.]